jgi:hypothetical protein
MRPTVFAAALIEIADNFGVKIPNDERALFLIGRGCRRACANVVPVGRNLFRQFAMSSAKSAGYFSLKRGSSLATHFALSKMVL